MLGGPGPCGRALVVDDDEGVRVFVAATLEAAGFAVMTAASGEEALRRTRGEPLDLAVLDVNLPGISGYAVCKTLREQAALRILFISGVRTESYDRVAGLLIGGDDYLVKPFAPDELVERARALMRRPAPAVGRGPARAPLTPREQEVLMLLAEGLQQAAIASRLVISPKTVSTHIEHILAKLGAHSRAEAVAIAFRDDLVSLPA